MIQDAHDYAVHALFNPNDNVIYTVPRFQREYSWAKTQWESLFDDIMESSPGYFLGSFICINQSKDTLSLQNLELVDGQQRLLTLSLLFAAVYDVLRSRESDLEDEEKLELMNLRRQLVLKKNEDQSRVVPQIQNNNNNDFRAVLGKIGIIKHFDTPSNAGNRKIFRAFRYFQDRLNQISCDDISTSSKVIDVLDKVNRCSLVKIEVASHADAYTLFESLNNRGMPLTPIDLIKNKLLETAESKEKGRIDAHFLLWNKLLEYLGDDYSVQERFFRQYYNAFKEDFYDVCKASVATRSNLIQIYEKLIEDDPERFMGLILNAGRLYALLLGRMLDDSMGVLTKPLRDLERIQGAPSYQLLLYLLARMKHLELKAEHIAAITRLLVSFFVRRNLTDNPPTRDLIRLFTAVVEKLNGVSGNEVIRVIRDQLRQVSSSDETFRERLAGHVYEDNSAVTRFILCALEEQGMQKETWHDLWRIENKHHVLSIEHIFPQGDNIPPDWVYMIADGDHEKAKEYQQVHVHRLGNLTISGYNSTLGNKSFEAKRDRTDTQGRYVGYRNGLTLNQDLATASEWTVQKIEVRTKKLVEQAARLFAMDVGTP